RVEVFQQRYGRQHSYSSDESPDEAANEFERATVDDVGGPMLEVVLCGSFGGRGGELEGGECYLIGAEKEECGEGSAGASGGGGDAVRRDAVDDAHDGAEGVAGAAAGLHRRC